MRKHHHPSLDLQWQPGLALFLIAVEASGGSGYLHDPGDNRFPFLYRLPEMRGAGDVFGDDWTGERVGGQLCQPGQSEEEGEEGPGTRDPERGAVREQQT